MIFFTVVRTEEHTCLCSLDRDSDPKDKFLTQDLEITIWKQWLKQNKKIHKGDKDMDLKSFVGGL